MSGSEIGSQRELRVTLEDAAASGARVKVIGVGGGGGNAVDRMVARDPASGGVDFMVANTDMQALSQNAAPVQLQIGAKLTNGLGAGADPQIGERAALEDTEQLLSALAGADVVFVTTGLGGGTGTGAAPIVTSLASELGALTIAVATLPFTFEGRIRARRAQQGLARLRGAADSVITIPNDRLLMTIDRNTSVTQAFEMVDEVLHQAVRGISDLILVPGLINLDFADVKTIMSAKGTALMGTGTGEGENRAVNAATLAVSSPMLEHAGLEGARSIIVNVSGGPNLSMLEVSEAAATVQEAAHEEANIIFGAVIHPEMEERVKVTVIATGFERESEAERAPQVPTGQAEAAVDQAEAAVDQAEAAMGQAETAMGQAAVAAGQASRRASAAYPAPRAEAIHAPTPVDLKDYANRQETLTSETAADAAPLSGPVGSAEGNADSTDGADGKTSGSSRAAPAEDTPAAQAIAKARALSNVALTRREAFDLGDLPDPLAAGSRDGSDTADPAADVEIDSDADADFDSVGELPAFLQSERQA